MAQTSSPQSTGSLWRDWRQAISYWLGGRFGMLVFAAVVVGAGLWFNWGWLVSLGLAPLVLAVLPCAAMCALGLCMRHGSVDSAQKRDGTDR